MTFWDNRNGYLKKNHGNHFYHQNFSNASKDKFLQEFKNNVRHRSSHGNVQTDTSNFFCKLVILKIGCDIILNDLQFCFLVMRLVHDKIYNSYMIEYTSITKFE